MNIISQLALLPLMTGITAPFAGWYRDKYGAFILIILGPCFYAASLIFICLELHYGSARRLYGNDKKS